MSAIAEKTLLTPDDLLALPDEKDYELVDGELLEKDVGAVSGWIAGEILYRLRDHCREGGSGWIFPSEVGFQCFPDRPRTVRKPDVSFVRASRMVVEEIPNGYIHLVPDLIVEVISPNDLADEFEEKVEMFYRAGVPLIWAVSPSARTIRIRRKDGTTTTLCEGDTLSGEDVIPGFACPVAALFPRSSPSPALQE